MSSTVHLSHHAWFAFLTVEIIDHACNMVSFVWDSGRSASDSHKPVRKTLNNDNEDELRVQGILDWFDIS